MFTQLHSCVWLGIAVCITATVPRACGDDWPMFGRDATRNSVSHEKDPPLDWDVGSFDDETGKWNLEKARNIKWQASLGSLCLGTPVVAEGLVWVGTNDWDASSTDKRLPRATLKCFRESDGTLLYEYSSTPLSDRGQDTPWQGLTSSPLVEKDRLWLVTNRAEVVCLDIGPLQRSEGQPKERWRVDTVKDWGVYPRVMYMGPGRVCSIGASYKGMIYVLTSNGAKGSYGAKGVLGQVPAPTAPSLVCLNKDTGKVVWQESSPGANLLEGNFSSPLLAEIEGRMQVIAAHGDGWIRAFDALTGKPIWQFDINPKTSKWHPFGRTARNYFMSTPVFYDGRIYISSGQGAEHGEGPGRLCCIDPTKKGDISPELAIDAKGKPLPRRRVQAVNSEAGEKAILNPNSGLVWDYTGADLNGDGEVEYEETFHRSVANVAIEDDLVIAADVGGLVHCFDAKNGKRYWYIDLWDDTWATPLIVDDKIYVADGEGEVAILNLSADPKKAMQDVGFSDELVPINADDNGTVPNMESPVYASPIFANGTLYVANRAHLFAISASDERTDTRDEESDNLRESGGQWPQWRGPNRDGTSNETGLLRKWPAGGPPLEWRVDGLGEGIASVSVMDGHIYTVGYIDASEYAIAIEQGTGELAWARRIGPAIQENRLMRWLSQRSPTVDGDRVYIVRADGDLICLRTTDGAELWRKNYRKDFGAGRPYWGICDYPLVDGDKLICSPCGPKSGLAALNKFTGDVIWTVPVPGLTRSAHGGGIVSTEVGGVRQYVKFSDKGVFGLAAEDGRQLWHFEKIKIRYGAMQTPIVRGDRVLISSGYGASIAVLKLAKQGSNFVVHEEFLREKLQIEVFQDDMMVIDDYIYVFLRFGAQICLSFQTGETIWKSERVRSRDGRRKVASIYADGHLIARRSDGVVQLIEPSPKGQTEKGTFTIPDHEPSIGATTPVIAGGRLYLRDNDRLFSFDLRENAMRTIPKTVDLRIADAVRDKPERDRGSPRSVFVPTPQDVVDKMLQIAEVKTDDVVYDLGSGDGRIVITAAKQFGCTAIGYEIDRELVELSRSKAKEAAVNQLVSFKQADIFTVDLSGADVIAVYLLPKQLELLVPQLQKLKPGSRIVSHQFAIPMIEPQQTIEIASQEDGEPHTIHLWTTPFK